MILYMQEPKDSTKRLLEFIGEFGKFEIYKINTQKSVVFVNTNNSTVEKKNYRSVSSTIMARKLKYLEMSLTKDMRNFYHKNYKTVKKEIE